MISIYLPARNSQEINRKKRLEFVQNGMNNIYPVMLNLQIIKKIQGKIKKVIINA